MTSNEPRFFGSVGDDGSVEVIRYDAADSRIRYVTDPVLDEPRLRDIIRDELRAEREREARATRARDGA